MKFDVSSKMRAQVEVTHILPEKYEKYRLPGAETEFTRGPFGFFIWQHYDTAYYTISQQHFMIASKVCLYPNVRKATVAINCMLRGDLFCKLQGKGRVPLIAGKYALYYIPPQIRNIAYFSKGIYETIDFEMEEEYLRYFAQDHPLLQEVYERFLRADDEGMQLNLSNINMNIREQISKIRASDPESPGHRIYVQNRISDILLQYLQDLQTMESTDTLVLGRHSKIVEDVAQYIKQNIGQKLLVSQLATENNIHLITLERAFKKSTGKTVQEFITDQRMEISTSLLSETNLPINEVANRVGYLDTAHFSKNFKSKFLITPSQFRKKWKDTSGGDLK